MIVTLYLDSDSNNIYLDIVIMEYGSTPYVGMAPKQNGVSINYV